MKETHRSFIRSGMGALLLWLLLLTACVGEELQKPLLGEGEGYLTLQIGAISAEVTSSTLTKATVPNAPTEEKLTITITNKSTEESQSFASISAVPNPLVLKAGVTYTVEASCGTNEALQDTPYFYDSSEVTIQANTNNPVSLKPSLGNAMITPVVSESLKQHYNNDWTLTASVGGKSLSLASATEGVKTLYARVGETVSLTFAGTNKADQPVSFNWTATGPVESRKEYKVQCDPDLSAFSNIQVTANAIHKGDSNGDLNRTDVELNSNLNGANGGAIEIWNVEVKYNGTTIRSYSGSAPNNLTMTQTAGWPYIPQGSTLSASVKLKAGDEITVGSTFALPAPIFEVEVSGDTSYSVYDRSGATEANKKNGSSIFDIHSTVKISNEILTNSNYANILPKVTYTTDTGKSSGELAYNASVGDFTDLAWQKHVLTATATFEGATASASIDCHVTGLPYTFNFYNNKNAFNQSEWNTNSKNVGYRGTNSNNKFAVEVNGNNGYAISPKFYSPRAVTLNYNIQAQYYVALGKNDAKKYSIDLHIGETSSKTNVATAYKSHPITGDNVTDEQHNPVQGYLDITLEQYYISIHHNNPNVTYWGAIDYLVIYKFELMY